MANDQIHIVLVDDNEVDILLVSRALQNVMSEKLILKTLNTMDGLKTYLNDEIPDLIMLDLDLPDCKPDDTILFLNQNKSQYPIIILSGHNDENIRLNAIKNGAQDFILKTQFDAKLLPTTIHYAIERHSLQQTIENIAEELKINQKKLIEAQAIAQMGSWEFDVFNMGFKWSEESLNILELNPPNGALSMKEFLDLVAQKDQRLVREVFRQAIEEDSEFNVDIALVMSDLTYKYVNIRVRSSQERELDKKVILGTIQDITSRKRIEEALKKSEEKYHNLFEQSRDAIYITSRDGYFIDYNTATTNLFGYEHDEMRQINVKDIYLNPFERVKFRKEIEDKGFVRDFDLKLKRKDGTPLECTITSSLWRSNDGKRLGYQGIIRDITEMRRNEELKKEKEVAERSSLMKQSFLANMSHEIRTPINAISGLSKLMLDTTLDPTQDKYIKGIISSSQHLLELVNDILDFSKIEAGKIEFEHIDFSINTLLNQVMTTLRYRAMEKGLEFNFNTSPELPENIMGDPTKLKQVLINLLTNAIKFTNEGSVTLDTNIIEDHNEFVKLEFKVTDTGIGIPQNMIKEIFSSFTQLGYVVTKQAEGTGLGLTITQQLVELQGGSIDVSSEEGKGTVFTVVLPYERSKEVSETQSGMDVETADAISTTGLNTVLIVEDKPLNQLVAQEMLKKQWPEVLVDIAENGKVAVEMATANLYDILLMDVQMPVMDGYEATRNIRRINGPASSVPILAMTAYATTGEAEKCLEAGMTDYISKPFEPATLYRKIQNLANIKPEATAEKHPEAVADIPKAQPTASENGHEHLNMDYLNRLTDGNETLRKQIVDLLLKETPDEVRLLNENLDKANWLRVKGVAHKMKSSATYLGLEETLSKLKKVEEYAREQIKIDEIPHLVNEISSNFELALKELEVNIGV